jgi:hypothetical protein
MMRNTSRSFLGICKFPLLSLVGLALVCGVLIQSASAGLFTLTDSNSSATFDTANPANNNAWVVDGVNHLYQQAFWFRVGATPEQSLHMLPIAVEGVTDTNFDSNPDTLFVRYAGAGFTAEVRYTLAGGSAGSLASDLAEQISIHNVSTTPLDFHFFQYVDFDLLGSSGGDTAEFINGNTVKQWEGISSLSETVITPLPSHREIDVYDVTLQKLNDALATTLTDLPALGVALGPNDMTWAFQWDVVIEGGKTFQISKDKNLTGVPEPASLALLAFAVLLGSFRRHQLG